METKTLSMAQAREQLTQMPERFSAEEDLQAITITRHGLPVLAVLPWELYESIAETLDIISDEEQLAALRQSIAEVTRDEGSDWQEAKARLGL